jgi:RNA polymerase sigma factor (sigma-70 family)
VEERTDIDLVALARNGDKDAFGLLAQRYQMTAQRFAMRLVAKEDSAQELAQEAMLQAYLSLDRLRDPARFKSWLCGIVLNVCRSHLRDREIAFFSLEAIIGGLQFYAVPLFNVPVTPEKIAEERELHRIVLDAINTLVSKDRDAMLLFYYAQLSLKKLLCSWIFQWVPSRCASTVPASGLKPTCCCSIQKLYHAKKGGKS